MYTDCWAAYRGIDGMNGIQHRTVNHSVSFRDGDVHTNTIEGKIYHYYVYVLILVTDTYVCVR